MRIFSAVIDDGLSPAARSAAAYALLACAVEKTWGISCPDILHLRGKKPHFIGTEHMYFSISHSGTRVLAAVSRHEVGADLEVHRSISPAFINRLLSPEMQQQFTFFEAWTLRESIFKLTGTGNLRSMQLWYENGNILSDTPGVRCRTYRSLDGYTASAACWDGDFPDVIEEIPSICLSAYSPRIFQTKS